MIKLRISAVLFSLIFLCSCEVDPFSIGSEWFDPRFRMVSIDTLSVKLSTVFEDSISTRNQNVALVGSYTDQNDVLLPGKALTGTTSAKSFIELNMPSKITVPDGAVFDSLVLSMRFNKVYFGDTLAMQHIGVYRLSENIELDERTSFYNTTNFNAETSPFTNSPDGAKFYSRPYSGSGVADLITGYVPDPLYIRLSDAFGQELLGMFIDGSDSLHNKEKFLSYFKGLVIVPGQDSKAIVGFRTDTSFKMQLHYHYIEQFKVEKHIDFTINQTQQFNQILADRTDSPLAPLNKYDNEISSFQTNNLAFVQSGVPLYAKIEFPTLNNLLGLARHGTIDRAVLYIKPAKFSYGSLNPQTPLPTEMNLYESSLSGGDATLLKDQISGQIMNGNLTIDHQYMTDTYYSYDITSFLAPQLGINEDKKKHLLLRMTNTDMQSTVKRLAIGDSELVINQNGLNTEYSQIQVKIYYTIYND